MLDVRRSAFDVLPSSMRILMISAEGPPLARATALVDVLEALPRELRARGHEIGIVMPFYREIRENAAVECKDTGVTVDVRVGAKNYVAEFLSGRTAGGVQIFYVRCDEFFDRAGNLWRARRRLRRQRRAIYFFQQGGAGIGAPPDAVAADPPRARLGGGARSGAGAGGAIAISHRPDHSSSGGAGQFLGTRFWPNESTGTLFHACAASSISAG